MLNTCHTVPIAVLGSVIVNGGLEFKAPNGLALNRRLIVEPVGLNRYLKRFNNFVNRFANGLGL